MQPSCVISLCLTLALRLILGKNIVTIGDYIGDFDPVFFYLSYRRIFHVNLVSHIISFIRDYCICLVDLFASVLLF